MEIERKFLVKYIPLDLDKYDKYYIEQGYLSFNPEIRLRSKNDKCFLTVKGEGTISREEYETEISLYTYNELSKKIKSKLLIKNRYIIPLYNDYIAELDIYTNLKEIGTIVEVEFPSVIEANNFIVPDWFGLEVTSDKKFKNKNLAIIS